MSNSNQTIPESKNPAFQESYKYLSKAAKAELHRLERIEECARQALGRPDESQLRPLSHLVNLILEYHMHNEDYQVDKQQDIHVFQIHYWLGRVEILL